jgi:hypothetical protein
MTIRRYTLNEAAFDVMDTSAHWYWLGFLLGDGSVLVRRDATEHRLSVTLWQRDRSHLERLSTFLSYDGPLHETRAGRYVDLAITSKHLCRRVIELGVVPRKSFGGHPMPEVPNRFCHAFMRGHFDANGHVTQVSKNGYKLGFAGQHRLMRWMAEKVEHLSGANRSLFYDRGGCAELVFGRRSQVQRVAEWMYGVDDRDTGRPNLARKRIGLNPILGEEQV